MRTLNLKTSNKKKIRGLKRKSNKMVEHIMNYTDKFPNEFDGCGYWKMPIPVAQSFIDSKKTPRSIRKFCIQTLINATEKLVKIKPSSQIKTRIVAIISLPNLWDSQITVFFDSNYFDTFFDRKSDYQKWISLSSTRNIQKEWGLNIPNNFLLKGYLEKINDEDYNQGASQIMPYLEKA